LACRAWDWVTSAWVQTFSDEFFREIYRLHDWDFRRGTSKRTPHVGNLIKHYIYEQLPPGVLAELERVNPKNQNGNRPRKHHQHLTATTGNAHLDKQISTVITLMRISRNRYDFEEFFQRALPPLEPKLPLVIDVYEATKKRDVSVAEPAAPTFPQLSLCADIGQHSQIRTARRRELDVGQDFPGPFRSTTDRRIRKVSLDSTRTAPWPNVRNYIAKPTSAAPLLAAFGWTGQGLASHQGRAVLGPSHQARVPSGPRPRFVVADEPMSSAVPAAYRLAPRHRVRIR
jgi:P63C domain